MPLHAKSIFGQLRNYAFVLLLPVWFILHANNAYFGLIPPELSFLYFFRYLLITTGFVLLSILLFPRKPAAGAVFSTILFFSFFLFGAVLDLLRSFSQGPISSYTVLLPALLIFVIGIFILLNYSKREYHRFRNLLKLLALVFIGVEIVTGIYNVAGGKSKQNDLSGDNTAFPAIACGTARPDIFYIVFDEYPSSVSLKDDLGFDNSRIDSLLTAAGFFIARQSVSNYNVSPFSLSSALDATFLKPGIESKSDAKLFIQALETYENNRLAGFLDGIGYSVKNYGCFDLRNSPLSTDHYFEDMYPKMIDGGTLWGRIERDILWGIHVRHIFSGKFRIPSKHIKKRDYHIYRNGYNVSALKDELQKRSYGPRFVMTHIMLPHEPFFLRSDGSLRSDTVILTNSLPPKEGFLDQVQYANKLLEEILSIALKNTGKDRVIILQGDHGYRFFDSKTERSKEFRNLNAIYFPDRNYATLYDSMSSVNTFRAVLNKYFCQQLPLLKDSTIFIETKEQ